AGAFCMIDDWSDEETDSPLYADERNFYKVEKWTRDGAKMYGLRWSTIPPYPIKHLAFANRVALIAAREGWCLRFASWFVDGHDQSGEQELTGAWGEIGQEPSCHSCKSRWDIVPDGRYRRCSSNARQTGTMRLVYTLKT